MTLLSKFWPFFILLTLVIIFFNKTLTGSEIFVTPDFARSDILNSGYPSKLFLSQSLKNGELPLWNPKVSSGFPELGLPTGVFNPINLLLFYFLSMPLAYNLGLASIFLTATISTYLFARSQELSKYASLAASIAFSFSGVFVSHIIHFSVIQTLSVFPLELYLAQVYFKKKSNIFIVLLVLIIGIQLLTGFFQIIAYSLIFLSAFIIWQVFFSGQNYSKKLVSGLFIAIIISFLIGAVQLIPSFELTQLSNRSEGVGEDINLFPYPAKHIITFIWPYLLGDPRIGTYPIPNDKWGLFWENNGYIGVIPVFLALAAIFGLVKKNKLVLFFTVSAAATFLLMLGQNSPFGFLYNFPPLSLFRVPARWIAFFSFSLSILAAFGFDWLLAKLSTFKLPPSQITSISLITLIVITTNLFAFGLFAQAKGNPKDWLAKTQTARFLENDSSIFRIYNIGNRQIWNAMYAQKGWLNNKSDFLNLLESQEANFNITQDLDQMSLYRVVSTQRFLITQEPLDIALRRQREPFTLTPAVRKILDLGNVKYIISPGKIEAEGLNLVFTTKTEIKFYIYENNEVLPRIFTRSNYQVYSRLEDAQKKIASTDFDPKTSVLLEKDPKLNFIEASNSAQITNYQNQFVEIKAQMEEDGIVVLADSYYPGWKAYIDGNEVEIIPANLNQRAIIVEKGEHQVEFKFEPDSFRKGAMISGVSLLFILLSFLYLLRFRRVNKG